MAAPSLKISAEASRKSRKLSHLEDELLSFIVLLILLVRILFATCVDSLDGYAKTGGDFLRRNAFFLPRTNKGYFLVGELALDCSDGGMVVNNRFLGRRSIVVVAFDIDGKIGRRKQSRFTLRNGTGAPASIGTLALTAGDDVEDTGRCQPQDVSENAGLGGRNGPGVTGGSERSA